MRAPVWQKKAFSPFVPQRGIALFMVIWILAILMVIVLSFSYMSRAETDAALSFRNLSEHKLLAEAGVERGLMEIIYRKHNPETIDTDDEAWKMDGRAYEMETDNGNYTIRIIDESGKVDINKTSALILKDMLFDFGLDEEEVDTIVDSILDWRDADDLYRLHGAESDYYLSLPEPYEAKNANFESVEELILVKGITPELLYGSEEQRGIIDFLTVNSRTGKININAAPREVLVGIPGMTPETADVIVEYRKDEKIRNARDLLGQDYSLFRRYITTGDSNIYTIDAVGFKKTERTGYALRATVSMIGMNSYKYLYYKSPLENRYGRELDA